MDLLRLTRPLNVILFLAATALGGVLVAGGDAFGVDALRALLLAMVSATLVGAGSNVINDLYDVEIDRVNKPDRPLAKGTVSARAAWGFWVLLSAGGVLFGAMVSPLHAAISAASVALLWGYSAKLKGTILLGNVAVAATIGLGVAFGGLAVGLARGPLWAGVGLGALIVFAREIAKDVEDTEGDRAGGARTLPIVWGERRALGLSIAVLVLVLAAVPLAAEVVGASFYVWGLPLATCVLTALWTLASAMASGEALRAPSRRASGWMKGALVAGIVGLVLARLG